MTTAKLRSNNGIFWRAAGILLVLVGMVWGGIYTISVRGIEAREAAIKENGQQITRMREEVAGINVKLEFLEKSNIRIERAVMDLLTEIRNDRE